MELLVQDDAEGVARRGADLLAAAARKATAARGRFLVALSGGSTPRRMLRALADEDVPWHAVHVFQVDERVAPAGQPERNLTHLQECLRGRVPLPEEQLYPMPVENTDLEAAARDYAATLARTAGTPPVLDLVHLGLGGDGHTASLVPDDPVLEVRDTDVAITARYEGRRRMTLTYPALDRARRVLWLVTGASKAAMLARLRAGDRKIPAGRVRRDRAVVLVDRATGTAARVTPGTWR